MLALSPPRVGVATDAQPHPQARNDLYAGEIKFVKDELSVMARLELVVPDGAGEDLVKAADGTPGSAGPSWCAAANCNTNSKPSLELRRQMVTSHAVCQPVQAQRTVAPGLSCC